LSILDREALQGSPLADLHAIASELSIDGYRRLRREALIDAILERQDGSPPAPEAAAAADDVAGAEDEPTEDEPGEDEPGEAAATEASPRRRRGRRGGSGRGASSAAREEEPDEPAGREAAEDVEGVVELLPNGSGFVRVAPPEPSDEDIYISAAQVKRCELVSGDRIAGPKREPRRSERFASLIRIDTINGRPASEIAEGARFDDLPAAFPSERLKLGSEDPTLKAIEWLTPFGRGSRVSIVGPSRSGKSEALRRLATALASQDELQVFVALAGVRPEEIAEWAEGPLSPVASASFAASAEAQDGVVELVVDQARRLASRGSHAVVLVDGLDGMNEQAARKATAAARNILEGGSLTVMATASRPLGDEDTVIALDLALAAAGCLPALYLSASGTIRSELLVGDAGAQAIADARAQAAGA